MKAIKIPSKLKIIFLYKTRELIFSLNQDLESNDFHTDPESIDYLNALSEIKDIGKRYEVLMRAFSDALSD